MPRLPSIALLVCAAGLCACLGAQNVGDPAVDKVFLSSWNITTGEAQLTDYYPAPGGPKIVLLEWWKST